MKTTLITLGVVFGLIALVAFGGISYYNSIQVTGTQLELGIDAQNNANTIELNQYVAGLYEQIGVANPKSAAMDKLLKDAVSGRYNLNSSADPSKTGSFFSAIHEAYPTLNLDVYDRILDYVRAKRDDYTANQTKLQDMLQNFQVWQLAGFPHSFFVRMIGFPNNNLKAMNDSGQMLYGQAALDYLTTISQPNGSNNGGGQRPVKIPGLGQ